MTAYCATCRIYLPVKSNPPYGVIHKDKELHLHALTREELLTL